MAYWLPPLIEALRLRRERKRDAQMKRAAKAYLEARSSGLDLGGEVRAAREFMNSRR